MDIAKMLNVTILACLLILTGCFGLGATDDDVIDDAEGQDTGSGSTTVVNTYPPVQSITGERSVNITVSSGEYIEVLNTYYSADIDGDGDWHISHWTTATINVDCTSTGYQGQLPFNSASYTHMYLPNDGSGCTYNFVFEQTANYTLNVIYRVWS